MQKLLTLCTLFFCFASQAQLCYSPAKLFVVNNINSQDDAIASDFNGDGHMDAAISSDGDRVEIRLGDGAGNFGASQVYNQSGGELLTGDFNSDGKLDLIAGRDLFFGTGTGTFITPPTTIPNAGSRLTLGDFNGDGFTDIASLYYAQINNYNVCQDTISILLGTGAGTFTLANKISFGWLLFEMSTGDYDNDGLDDLALLNAKTSSMGVTVFKSLGNGNFSAGTDFNVPPAELQDIKSIDLNGDNNLDIVTANGASNSVYVLMGTSAGNFASPVAYATDSDAVRIAVADLNNDGILDIAASTPTPNKNSISVLAGNGNGTFASVLKFPLNNLFPGAISVADFNSDGKLDFLMGGGAAGNSHFGLVLNGPIALNITGAANICPGTNEI